MSKELAEQKQRMYDEFITRRGSGEDEFDAFCGAFDSTKQPEFVTYQVVTSFASYSGCEGWNVSECVRGFVKVQVGAPLGPIITKLKKQYNVDSSYDNCGSRHSLDLERVLIDEVFVK